MRRLCVLVALLTVVSCGGGSPTKPSSSIPTVSGSYSGTATLNFPQLQVLLTCPASTTVTQSGSTINLSAIVLGGACATSIPVGQVSIDSNGTLIGIGSGTATDPSCGSYSYTGNGGFSGRDFHLSLTSTSAA